jgi:hypothetical protein
MNPGQGRWLQQVKYGGLTSVISIQTIDHIFGEVMRQNDDRLFFFVLDSKDNHL